MNDNAFFSKYIGPYTKAFYIHDKRGFIVWRPGTGDNVELLHIKTYEKGRGYGKQLVSEMIKTMQKPYYSVFGFTRVSNENAQSFYAKLGFSIQKISGPYKDGESIFFWAPVDQLDV